MTLRQQLSDGPIVVAPGVYDALGASLAQKAGFGTLYLSGASIAYTRFGRPDIGLVGMSEVAETLGIEQKAASIRYIRALRRLKEILAQVPEISGGG